jgi:hypothetical protein
VYLEVLARYLDGRPDLVDGRLFLHLMDGHVQNLQAVTPHEQARSTPQQAHAFAKQTHHGFGGPGFGLGKDEVRGREKQNARDALAFRLLQNDILHLSASTRVSLQRMFRCAKA